MVYWCDECKVPVRSLAVEEKKEVVCGCCKRITRELAQDLRPVFPEEKVLLELLWDMPERELEPCSVWNSNGGTYYIDGKSKKLIIKNLALVDTDELRIQYDQRVRTKEDAFGAMIERFVLANHGHFNRIDKEAKEYIQRECEGYTSAQMFTSFSGGKDSTVVADLARRALATDKLMHIFGDTTLEFPDTMEYVERYKKEHPKTPFISSKNKDKNFMELCEQLGPPSRVMRWCCTIFKTGAINRKISNLFRRQSTILSFQGIRRAESASRSKYDRTSRSSKIAKQVALAPAIDWTDLDVWLYILTTGIDFNSAYRKGYSRVGCWCCPNNGLWSEFLSKIHMPEQYHKFHDFLVNFAIGLGKPDAIEYVDSGAWKARQGGNGVDYAKTSFVSFTPCATEENAFNYTLQKPITEEFYELFKPFGTLDFAMGNERLGEVYVVDKDRQPVLKLQGRLGKTKLKISILKLAPLRVKSYKAAKEKMDCQVTKYQMCMGCRGCESACKFNAIAVKTMEDGSTSYIIDENKCVGCLECVNHFIGGCYIRKVLAVKRDEKE